MRIRILAVGKRSPDWVNAGVRTYAERMPRECRIDITPIAPARGKGRHDSDKARAEEGERLLSVLPGDIHVVAMDGRGRELTSRKLADRLGGWLAQGRDTAILIGGAEGLDERCLERAHFTWSLSPLTFPHGLVKVLVTEQLYRASTILGGHPYHR